MVISMCLQLGDSNESAFGTKFTPSCQSQQGTHCMGDWSTGMEEISVPSSENRPQSIPPRPFLSPSFSFEGVLTQDLLVFFLGYQGVSA